MKNKYLSARVSRVSRLCPIFRAQPGAYPSEAPKPALRRRAAQKFDRSPAQRVRSKEEMQRNGRDLPLAAGRGIWSLHRRKAGERPDAFLRPAVHFCPQCGQFRGFTRAFQKAQKSAMGCCRMKKARRFKEYSGVPTKDTR